MNTYISLIYSMSNSLFGSGMSFWNGIWFVLGWLFDKLIQALPLPENVYFSIQRNSLHILKWIFNVNIEIDYVTMTQDADSLPEEFMQIKEIFSNIFEDDQESGDWIIYNLKNKNFNQRISFKPTYIESNDYETLQLTNIEIEIHIDNIKYRRFTKDMLDMIQTKNIIQNTFLKHSLSDISSESLTCFLSKSYRFSGIFSDFNLSNLEGKINDNIITFYPNKVRIFGTINSELIDFIKRMIAFYY